jgi:hypothetical protein
MATGRTTSAARGVLLLIVAVAVVLRLVDFPPRYFKRDFDEQPYVQGGLALWEGITPTYDRTPAGPQTWISWAYAAGYTARYLVFPTPEERATPLVLRPFRAGDHALFDIYRDWSLLRWIEVAAGGIVAVVAAGAAFKLGWKRGGWLPAILVGLTAATLPLFVEFSGQARPYAMAWGFGIIALYYAACSQDRPAASWRSAVFMGLAIASRVDMLLLLPLAWTDIWDAPSTGRRRVSRIVLYTLLSAAVSLLVAPWLLTDLVGNLRAIASVRIAEPAGGATSARGTMLDFFVQQGLGIDLILVVCALFLVAPDKRWIRWSAAIYVLLLSVSMLKGTGFGLRHQGAPIVALVTFAGVGMAAVAGRWPRLAPAILVLALILPAVCVIVDIVQRKHLEMEYHATAWIQRHVPPGALIYVNPNIRDPLPTVAASNALWDEVANENAWTTKLEWGMKRFHISSENLPRAFSENDMVVERGLRREWFILGSRPAIPDPRYDIRVYVDSVVFRINDVAGEFKRTGGVLVCNDDDGAMPTDVGTPVVQWINSQARGVRIYCSPDVLPKLLDSEHLQAW